MAKQLSNIVGWLGVGLIFLSVGLWWFGQDRYMVPMTWAGLGGLVLYGVGHWREIKEEFGGSRRARYGSLSGVTLVVVLGILVAVNYIGARQKKRWDLTLNQAFSLSQQSRQVLARLDAPLQVMVFAQEEQFGRYQDRLKEYEYVSKQVSTQYVDPEKKPTVARQHAVQQYGVILLSYKGRTERVTSESEQDITNGIIKVTTGQQKKAYFTQGHGEHDADSTERDGYSGIAAALRLENYTLEKLVIAQQAGVPADAAVVVVAGPKVDFYPVELDALKKYLDRAGKLLLAIDPPDKPESPALTGLVALAHDWGVDLGKDVVVDASGVGRLLGTDASVPVAASYPSHAITQRFNMLTAFPLARSANVVEGGVNGHVAQSFVLTSKQSWADTDVKAVLTTGQAKLEESRGDKPGPISIAAAVAAPQASAASKPDARLDDKNTPEPPKAETRVVVFGDSDFASNAGLGIQGNRDLFMNTLGWLSQQEDLIAIRPNQAADRRLTMPASSMGYLVVLSLVFLPGLIFGVGIRSWWRRR